MFKKYQLLVFVLIITISLAIKGNTRNKQQNTSPATTNINKAAEQLQKMKDIKKTSISSPKTPEKQLQNEQKANPTTDTQQNKQKSPQITTTKPLSSSHKASKQSKTAKNNKQKSATNKKSALKAEETVKDQSTPQGSNQNPVATVTPPKYQHSVSALFIVYLLIFMVLVVGIKYVYFPNSNFIQLLLDIIIMVTEYRRKLAKSGYSAPQYNEEVDDSNSITVGYTEDHAKQLFWERNSVQGI